MTEELVYEPAAPTTASRGTDINRLLLLLVIFLALGQAWMFERLHRTEQALAESQARTAALEERAVNVERDLRDLASAVDSDLRAVRSDLRDLASAADADIQTLRNALNSVAAAVDDVARYAHSHY